MSWLFISLALLAAFLAASFMLAARRRQRVSIEPIFRLQPGSFERLARKHLPQPPLALAALEESSDCAPRQGGAEPRRLIGVQTLLTSPKTTWMAAAADGVSPALGVWERWSTVDRHVFQAFSHLAREQIDGVADLLRVVDAKGYAVESAGFTSKLLGHVGEWRVHEHLTSAGAEVAMPLASNNPAVDLWVDGHSVNVKTWQDATSATYAHFAVHPDVPIVVPFDATRIPADALHFDPSSGFDAAALEGGDRLVIVDDAFSYTDVHEHTSNALDVIGDPGPHAHFPWVTAAISGLREARLLVRGHTDLARAAKNVAIDATAVAGGGALGMKTGALLGTAFGPLGAVVGGLAGGLLGTLAGRATANAVKKAPLDAAKTQYGEALRIYREKESALVAETEANWRRAQDEEGRILRASVERLRGKHEGFLNELERRLRASTLLDRAGAKKLLDQIRTRIVDVCNQDRAALRTRIPAWCSPLAGLFAPAEAQACVRHDAELREWDRRVESLLLGWSGSASDTSGCFDLVLAVPSGTKLAEEHLSRTDALRKQAIADAGNQHQHLLEQAVSHRLDAVERLRERWTKVRDEVEASLEPMIDALRTSANHLKQELRKSGIEVT